MINRSQNLELLHLKWHSLFRCSYNQGVVHVNSGDCGAFNLWNGRTTNNNYVRHLFGRGSWIYWFFTQAKTGIRGIGRLIWATLKPVSASIIIMIEAFYFRLIEKF